jgi:hypothetical protein
MNTFHSAVAAAKTAADLEEVAQEAIGSSGLMEFVRLTPAKSCARNEMGKGPKSYASSSVIRSS